MTTKTIKFIYDKVREFSTQHGTKASIKVQFDDGSEAELTTNPDKVEDRKTALTALVGKPSEFGLEDRGKWDDGNPKPFRITDYPGKPQSRGGPSGGGSYETPEERATRNASIQTQKAVAETLRATQVAIQAGAVLVEYDEAFQPSNLMNWVKTEGISMVMELVEEHSPKMLDLILREQGRVTQQKAPSAPTAGSPAPLPGLPRGAPSVSTTEPLETSDDRVNALNKALEHFKTPAALKRAYKTEFHQDASLPEMTVSQLLKLVENISSQ